MNGFIRRSLMALGCALQLAACGDDGGASAVDTAPDTAQADVATTEDAAVDASVEDGADVASGPCTDPAASAPMAAGGLALSVCGATLTVPAGALPDGVTVGLAVVAPPIGPPFEAELLGAVVEVTVEQDFAVPATLHLPDPSPLEGYRRPVRYEPATHTWANAPSCPVTGGFDHRLLFGGDYALLRDTVVFPAAVEGLGSGTVTTKVGADERTWSTDQGFAIYDVGASGLRSATVEVTRARADGSVEHLAVALTEEADHSFTPKQVQLQDGADASAAWMWRDGADGPPTSTSVLGLDGGRILGSFTATAGGKSGTVTLDVVTERYRYPPTRVCPVE